MSYDYIHQAIQELYPNIGLLDYLWQTRYTVGDDSQPVPGDPYMAQWSEAKLGPLDMDAITAKCGEIANRKSVILTVTAAQAKVALIRTKRATADGSLTRDPATAGTTLMSLTKAVMANYPEDIQEWFNSARDWERGNAYVAGIAAELGLTDTDIDDLFVYANTLDR